MSTETILIAEDETIARLSLTELLENQGFRVIATDNGNEALSSLLQNEPDIALLDVRMPGLDGISVLRRARESGADTALIVMTAHGDSNIAIEAMRLGAYDYISKPIDFEQLLPLLTRALKRRTLSRRSGTAAERLIVGSEVPMMIGHSPAMQHVYKLIGQVAASDATVLVWGESGTGKELVVNAIHHNSARAQGPLIKVNCAAIPETLLESELFGHEKGAFTNAMYRRIGRFEEARGGTLFLDEIGELASALQSKLLRAVQERTIERLGSNTPIQVDLRLVTATSRDLEEAVGQGKFREDLYYRLNVITIELPPLRERRQDVPPLVQHFLQRGGRAASITPSALAMLCDYHWPGNVRELENAIERAAVLARSGIIDESDIQLRPVAHRESAHWTEQISLEEGWKANLAAAEKSMVERALRKAEGNKSRAAELLGIHRRLLYEKLREHGLEDEKT